MVDCRQATCRIPHADAFLSRSRAARPPCRLPGARRRPRQLRGSASGEPAAQGRRGGDLPHPRFADLVPGVSGADGGFRRPGGRAEGAARRCDPRRSDRERRARDGLRASRAATPVRAHGAPDAAAASSARSSSPSRTASCPVCRSFFGAEIRNGFHVPPVPPSPGSCVALSLRDQRLNADARASARRASPSASSRSSANGCGPTCSGEIGADAVPLRCRGRRRGIGRRRRRGLRRPQRSAHVARRAERHPRRQRRQRLRAHHLRPLPAGRRGRGAARAPGLPPAASPRGCARRAPRAAPSGRARCTCFRSSRRGSPSSRRSCAPAPGARGADALRGRRSGARGGCAPRRRRSRCARSGTRRRRFTASVLVDASGDASLGCARRSGGRRGQPRASSSCRR